MYRFVVAGLALSLALFGTACTNQPKKTYIESDDPKVQQCISQCNVEKVRCSTEVTDAYKRCQNSRDYRMRQYNYCKQTGQTGCVPPGRCPTPRTKQCKTGYDQCYWQCGGRIEVEDPEPN